MHILFIGYGKTSQRLAKQLFAHGHQISTVSRHPKDDVFAKYYQQDVASLDLSQIDAVDVVYVLLAPSRKAVLEDPIQAYQQTYLETAYSIIQQLKMRRFKRLVVVSSTRVYGENQGQVIDDETEIQPADVQGEILRKMELAYLDAFPMQTILIRPSGIYGESVVRMQKMASTLQSYPNLHWSNRIHYEDLIHFLELMIHVKHPKSSYIVSAEPPKLLHEIVQWFQQQMGLPELKVENPKVVTGKKLYATHLQQMGFELKHQDCLSDYRGLMQR